jgi:hypothetical protein
MLTTEATSGIPRWVLTTGGLLSVAALAACGSASSNSSTSAATPTATSSAAGPITSAKLAAYMNAGSSVTSLHLTMSVAVGNRKVLAAEGDEALAAGKVSAMSLSEQVGPNKLMILVVDGGVYVKLPPSMNKGAKPWLKASVGSTNPVLRQLAASLGTVEQSATLTQYGSFAQAASSLRTVGTEQVNGQKATHYSLIVDVAKVHSAAISAATKAEMSQAGVTNIPVDIWVDGQGHPVKVSDRFTLKGQVVSTDVSVSRLNQPVTITAPPASQVSTSQVSST